MGLDELRVRYSLVLELNRFTNIHLFEKGFYQVRATVLGPPNSAVICENLQLDEQDCAAQELTPGIQDNTAISSTFKVIMKKAVIKLNNAFIFSVDVPGDVSNFISSCTVPISIQFQLFHCKLLQRPKNPDSLELCTTLTVNLNYSPAYGLHYCKEDMFEYMYMAQVRYSVHMVMVDIDNPPHTLLSHCWEHQLPVLSVLDDNISDYKEMILNIAAVLSGTLLSAYDFLKSSFSNLQDTLPAEFRHELKPADAVVALETVLNTLSDIDSIDDAQDQFIHDLKSISKSIHVLWFEFLECFIHSKHIQQVLLERFRAVQLERLKEACFTQSHARERLYDYKGPTLSGSIGNYIRASRYMNTIPALPLHANDNDGVCSEVPIILEDLFDWEPYNENPISVPKHVLDDAMTELRVWDPIMRRPHVVVQLDSIKIKAWRDSQENGVHSGGSLDSIGEERVKEPSNGGAPPECAQSSSSKSTFYTTSNDEIDNILIVDLEPDALDPNIRPTRSNVVSKPTRPPPIQLPKVPDTHRTINALSRKTIRLLKSEVTHIHFEQSRRDLIGSNIMQPVHFLTDTEGSRMMGNVFVPTPHLVICAHGLEGASNDLRQVRIFLQLALPKSDLQFLMSDSYMEDTYRDIGEMGDMLAEDIVQTIMCSPKKYERISFIGHSLGCLVIRAALGNKLLEPFQCRFHTFLSLSGPHLGMLYSSSYLVNGGLWLMQRLKAGKSLQQMSMKDHSDLKQCFLYRLSQRDQLYHFKNIVLISSHQDRYVPYHSTRIEMCNDAKKDYSYTGHIYRDMVNNIMRAVADNASTNVVRYSVQYHIEQGSASSMIGRAAHIACLDSEVFLNKFFSVMGWKYFV